MTIYNEAIQDTVRKITLNDDMLTRQIGFTLTKHYPGHVWAVNVNSQGGVVDLKAYNISTHYGYRLLYTDVSSDPDLKCIVRAGGELLERAHMIRGGRNEQKLEILEGVKKGHQELIKSGFII